ncbi:MAG: hypothetical protein IPM29_19480 [Planctomycetes bacterium]|nr:hypothetical protein [Planctomycetota bacterium]
MSASPVSAASLAAVLLLGACAGAPPRGAGWPAVDVRELGARGDGRSDDGPAIRRALDRARELATAHGGARVFFPAAAAPYLVRGPLEVTFDHVELSGARATLAADPSAGAGDLLVLRGAPARPLRDVAVRGLTLDARVFERGEAARSRGVVVEHVQGVELEGLTVRAAWVGVALGPGSSDARVHRVVVTDWHNDAFVADGGQVSGGSAGLRFESCVAQGARDETSGGSPGRRDGAFVLRDGVRDVVLSHCEVRDTDADGYVLANERCDGPLTTSRIRFEHCGVDSIRGFGFTVLGRGSRNRVQDVLLLDCRSSAPSRVGGAVDVLVVRRGSYGMWAYEDVPPTFDAAVVDRVQRRRL